MIRLNIDLEIVPIPSLFFTGDERQKYEIWPLKGSGATYWKS